MKVNYNLKVKEIKFLKTTKFSHNRPPSRFERITALDNILTLCGSKASPNTINLTPYFSAVPSPEKHRHTTSKPKDRNPQSKPTSLYHAFIGKHSAHASKFMMSFKKGQKGDPHQIDLRKSIISY